MLEWLFWTSAIAGGITLGEIGRETVHRCRNWISRVWS